MASLLKRNGVYYAQVSIGGKTRRQSLRTDSKQVAKEKIRQIESRLAQGDDNPLPTRTAIGDIVAQYVRHIRSMKTAKSAATDIAYLRQLFGECCPEVANSARRIAASASETHRRARSRRTNVHPLQADCFERLTTAQITDWIAQVVRVRGLAPKTANRYREILTRLFNWAISEGRIRPPSGGNPAARVHRYHERAPEIRFLSLAQIDEQLTALEHDRQLQTLVALYIYAGLRREEVLWLTSADIDLHTNPPMIRVRAKTIDGEHWQPKTKRNRAVPISSTLLPYLVRYRPVETCGRWFFPSPRGCRWDPDNFSHRLSATQRKAGLRWACLDYRHTFGSHLAQRGISLHKIATLMGNSPEICRRHYAALVPEAMAGDVEFGLPGSRSFVNQA
jgi:integrase